MPQLIATRPTVANPPLIPLTPFRFPLCLGRQPDASKLPQDAIFASCSTITLANHAVSRNHAIISCTPSGVYQITDLGTINGTLINSVRIGKDIPSPLKSGDIISFGGGGGYVEGDHVGNEVKGTPFVYRFVEEDRQMTESFPLNGLKEHSNISHQIGVKISNQSKNDKLSTPTEQKNTNGGFHQWRSNSELLDDNNSQDTEDYISTNKLIRSGGSGYKRRRIQDTSSTSVSLTDSLSSSSKRLKRENSELDINSTQEFIDDDDSPTPPSSQNENLSLSQVSLDFLDSPSSHTRSRDASIQQLISQFERQETELLLSPSEEETKKLTTTTTTVINEDQIDPDTTKTNDTKVLNETKLDILENFGTEFNCSICYELMVAPHNVNPCGHVFCGICLFSWLEKNNTCPECRMCIPPENATTPAFKITSLIEMFTKTMKSEELAERKARMEEWQAYLKRKQSVKPSPLATLPFSNSSRYRNPRSRVPYGLIISPSSLISSSLLHQVTGQFSEMTQRALQQIQEHQRRQREEISLSIPEELQRIVFQRRRTEEDQRGGEDERLLGGSSSLRNSERSPDQDSHLATIHPSPMSNQPSPSHAMPIPTILAINGNRNTVLRGREGANRSSRVVNRPTLIMRTSSMDDLEERGITVGERQQSD